MFQKKYSISLTFLSCLFLSVGSHIYADGDHHYGSGSSPNNPVHHAVDDATGAHQGGYNSNSPSSSHQYYQQHSQQYSNDPGYHIDQHGNRVYHNQQNQQPNQYNQQSQQPRYQR